MYSKTSRQPRLLGEGEIKATWDHCCKLSVVLKPKGSGHSYSGCNGLLFYAVSAENSNHLLRIFVSVKTKDSKPRYVNLSDYTVSGMFTEWKPAGESTGADKGKQIPFEIEITGEKNELVMSGFIQKSLSLSELVRTEPAREAGK